MSTEKAARLADVAKAAGVSQGTVSNVFNRPDVVREEVRTHVRDVAKKLGYRGADPKGRLLRAGKVNAIGVATTESLSDFFSDPFKRVLMTGITEVTNAAGAGISLVSAANEEELAWNIRSAIVDGFILFCLEDGERLVERTRERQLPFVALALGRQDETISAIGIDDRAAARLAAQHIVDLGHRDIALLTLPFDTTVHNGPTSMDRVNAAIFVGSKNRVLGTFDVLGKAGIDTASVPLIETQNDDPSVAMALEELFASKPWPTAIIAQSDRVAIAALAWFRSKGISVPGDVSVIGFDGVPESATSVPPLTTIEQPILDIGRHAARAVLEADGKIHQTMLETTLVVRDSTGRPNR